MTLDVWYDRGAIDNDPTDEEIDAIILERAEAAAESPADDEMDRADLHDAIGREPTVPEWNLFVRMRTAGLLKIEDDREQEEAELWPPSHCAAE